MIDLPQKIYFFLDHRICYENFAFNTWKKKGNLTNYLVKVFLCNAESYTR